MKKNSFLLDKYSNVKNNPLFIGKQIYEILDREIDIDTLIRKLHKKRKTQGNIVDEARIINSIAMLNYMGKVKYYKGYIVKC